MTGDMFCPCQECDDTLRLCQDALTLKDYLATQQQSTQTVITYVLRVYYTSNVRCI